jgi:hypothetical protein
VLFNKFVTGNYLKLKIKTMIEQLVSLNPVQAEELLADITALNQMLVEGKPLEAFEKFYHPEVVMQENHQTPTIGKAANRIREQNFYGKMIELRRNIPLKVAVGEGYTMVEWLMDFTHQEWGAVVLHQVAVQVWQDRQIIKENFFYSL